MENNSKILMWTYEHKQNAHRLQNLDVLILSMDRSNHQILSVRNAMNNGIPLYNDTLDSFVNGVKHFTDKGNDEKLHVFVEEEHEYLLRLRKADISLTSLSSYYAWLHNSRGYNVNRAVEAFIDGFNLIEKDEFAHEDLYKMLEIEAGLCASKVGSTKKADRDLMSAYLARVVNLASRQPDMFTNDFVYKADFWAKRARDCMKYKHR